MDNLEKKYQNIQFRKCWTYTPEIFYMIGECESLLKAITNTPIRPDFMAKLHSIALIRGAQATTAIEGNTLSIEEIQKIQEGKNLPPSKEYLQIEVENIIKAYNTILDRVINKREIILINSKLIKDFNYMVGKDLGEHFNAIPGKFRNNIVRVGNYRAPDYNDVQKLVSKLCEWLKVEFHFKEEQNFLESIIQAIVTHIYIAWIHPFSDGNGRTARLLEFYLLLRSGVPDIASHVLSNFYNITRSDYYRQIENATEKKDLTDFITYAVKGFRDGLHETLSIIQENQVLVTWRNYVYGIFDKKMNVGKTTKANKRRRNLLLEIPYDKFVKAEDINNLKTWIIKEYANLSEVILSRDLKELVELELLEKTKDGYRARIEVLKEFMAVKI